MITTQELVGRDWRFSRSTGEVIARTLRFEPDGGFGGDTIGEAGWKIRDGALLLLQADGTVTNRFDRRQLTKGGFARLCGTFLMAPGQSIHHFLDPSEAAAPLCESRFNISTSLSGETDTLLVILNSAGRPSEGTETRWEFFDLPLRLGLDHVRIAEVRSPTVYYLDKLARLESLLGAIIAGRYRTVILIGMSSGAYASLMLAERLCRHHPDCAFHSFVINPPTAFSKRHREFVSKNVPYGQAAELLTDFAVSRAGSTIIDIEVAVLANPDHRDNVRHVIFYDDENLSENYYISLVSDLPGFHPHPVSLGLSHVDGAIAMFDRNLVQEAVARLVAGGAQASTS